MKITKNMVEDPNKYNLTDERIKLNFSKDDARYSSLIRAREAVRWKELWDEVLNNKKFREDISRGREYIIKLNDVNGSTNILNSTLNKHIHGIGTIYFEWYADDDLQSEGHYIGFYTNDKELVLFDPARSPSHVYGDFLTDKVVEYIRAKTGKMVRVLELFTQCRKGDTFCQTWSLDWARKKTKYNVTQKTAASILYDIIKDISKTEEFERASRRVLRGEHDETFQVLKDADHFINFTRKSLTVDHIDEILKG